MLQLSHGAPSGLSLSSHSPKVGTSSVWTSTMPLSKCTTRIQSKYIFPEDSQTALGSDPEGPQIKEAWKYSSVVGMLLYLSTNTRPDIVFAVSQVASNPKQSHASAVKMIIRYLSATSGKGIIFTPTTDFKVDCYVDADFTGLH